MLNHNRNDHTKISETLAEIEERIGKLEDQPVPDMDLIRARMNAFATQIEKLDGIADSNNKRIFGAAEQRAKLEERGEERMLEVVKPIITRQARLENAIAHINRVLAKQEENQEGAFQDFLRVAAATDALEERIEEMDRNARDTDRRIDTLRGLMLDVELDTATATGNLDDENLRLKKRIWKLENPEPKPIEKFKMEAMLNTEPIKKAPQPGDPDLPEPVESPVTPLVEEVRIKAIDPIYKHMGGRHNTPYYWPGTNAYARDAVLAVADNIERDADTYDRPHMTSMLRGFAAYLRGKAGKP